MGLLSKTLVATVVVLGSAFAQNAATEGYRLQNLSYSGPGEWRTSTDPIWVYDYHLLTMRYRVTGLDKSDKPVLVLRPGSVGPVTPGGNNPENPFVSGGMVTAIHAKDLTADGAEHEFRLDLAPMIRTVQMDQVIFVLPAGAKLTVASLEFLGEDKLFPCAAAAKNVSMPAGATGLRTQSRVTCGEFPATSMRGKESIRIEGGGSTGRTLYLNLMVHLAGLTGFPADVAPENLRIKESTEPMQAGATIHYADGTAEKQFPLLVSQKRHVLVNGEAALYALALSPAKKLDSVELMDNSPHAQMVLYGAWVSADVVTASVAPAGVPLPAASVKAGPAPDLTASKWYRVETKDGKTLPPDVAQIDFHSSDEARGKTLRLAVRNNGRSAVEWKVVFPALDVRVSKDSSDVYYVFPSRSAKIGNAAGTMAAAYGPEFLLQFVDVFAPAAGRGMCAIVNDRSGQLKTFRLTKDAAAVQEEVEYWVKLGPGESFQAPNVSLVYHGGDWHEGFAAYRNWVNSWYHRGNLRAEWLGSAPYARRDYPVGGTDLLYDEAHKTYTFDKLVADGKAFGGVDMIDISGWALSDKLGRVGDYPIELGGPENLRSNIAGALKQGLTTGLYFEGYLIDKNSAVGSGPGAKWQIIDANGKGVWWPGGSPEFFACSYVTAWQKYLAGRMASVAKETGAQAVYLDEYGCASDGRRCYSADHGHAVGAGPMAGEMEMAKAVRQALDAGGMQKTVIYAECNPVDAAAPYFDAAFCYGMPRGPQAPESVRLNLWRFVFPDLPVWEMVTSGIYPRSLSAENFKLALWHGDGMWLKGRSDTWFGADLLAFLQRARRELKDHSAAFRGTADPLVASPDAAILVNRFAGGGETVYTLFNSSYRTVQFTFLGKQRSLEPRDVDVVAVRR